MDPVSHAVLGRIVTLAAGPARSSRGLTAASILGALSPDIDFVLMPAGWDIYLRFHGVGTHSLVGALTTACGSALLVKAFARSSPFRLLAAASVLGALSHIAADIVSGGQISPAWPLAGFIPFAPLVAMADPWTIAVLALGAVGTWWWRQRRRRAAQSALALLVVFLCLKSALLTAALARATFSSAPPATGPRLVEAEWGALTRWHVYNRDARALRHWTIDARGGPAELILVQELPDEATLVATSRSLGTVRNFLRVHELAFAVTRPADEGSVAVLWSDIRYCERAGSAEGLDCALWCGGTFASDGRVLSEQVRVGAWWQIRAPRAHDPISP